MEWIASAALLTKLSLQSKAINILYQVARKYEYVHGTPTTLFQHLDVFDRQSQGNGVHFDYSMLIDDISQFSSIVAIYFVHFLQKGSCLVQFLL